MLLQGKMMMLKGRGGEGKLKKGTLDDVSACRVYVQRRRKSKFFSLSLSLSLCGAFSSFLFPSSTSPCKTRGDEKEDIYIFSWPLLRLLVDADDSSTLRFPSSWHCDASIIFKVCE